ncbi:MAG: isoleucine--tRNA ligase [Oscillospiraceae bacterium]|jgi:isoleucyl-tRNA synthetase|nr:isoleucine--tRNA ligase [Oscillospiraceae bacterium]
MKDEFIQKEHEILEFWEQFDCFGKRRTQAAGKPRFKFIDGPITANNPMGIHHAWGRSLKDLYIRYKMLQGYDCRCQNGFDGQGLWVEVGVEKELGFQTKRDIEDFGLDRFTKACVERVDHFEGVIANQSKRLGQWMDWPHSYETKADYNIEGIWYFLHKCHTEGLLRQEYKPMPWCPRCGTSLSEHEMTGSYRQMTHDSVFFQLPLEGRDYNILVWTTTPWTLSSNVALAVNPENDYCIVRLHSQDKPIVLGKEAIKQLGADKAEVLQAIKGAELVGLKYETCFPELPKLQGITNRIVAWEDVDAHEGTGVVHIAPGCGAEDYALGLREHLAQVMPVDDEGVFFEGFGFYSGKKTDEVAPLVFEELKARDKLYKVEAHAHSYPICWRCKTPIIFRLVPSWFIATEPLRERLLSAARSVEWNPPSAGKRMEDWLSNMGDWNISRKRYYGLPMPFYPCECGELTVISSRAHLRSLAADPAAVDALPELHRPWIDGVEIVCPKCGKHVLRIPDTGDVWLDAGIVPYSTTGYFTDREEWQKNFPADWIVEMSEQVRLWFYAMLFMSVVLEDCAPYRKAMCHASVIKEDGGRFSKTGYMIRFDEAAEQIGADAVRYLYAGNPTTSDVRFGFSLGDEARRKLLNFKNIVTFFNTYASIDKPNCRFIHDFDSLCPMDRWLLLRSNSFLSVAEKALEEYRHPALIKAFEEFVDDISNWYIRLGRRRYWKSEDPDDQIRAYQCLFHAIRTCAVVMSPVIPFMTESVWQDCIRVYDPGAPLSVHLSYWPMPLEGLTDENGLVERVAVARDVIATALKVRNEQSLKVRQPLQTLYILADEDTAAKLTTFAQQIMDELNVKELNFIDDPCAIEVPVIGVNFKAAGAVLKKDVNRFKEHLLSLTPADHEAIAAALSEEGEITVPGWGTPLAPGLFTLSKQTKPGIASAQCQTPDLTIALDTNLTDALRKEGLVRDLIRQCQILRKEADFAVEQRIHLGLQADNDSLAATVAEAEKAIAAEVLAQTVALGSVLAPIDVDKTVELSGGSVRITMKA